MINRVVISKRAAKQVLKCPVQVQKKLRGWVDTVTREGVEEVRKIPGHHDEPLGPPREGQRSVRLNRGYRAFYVVRNDGTVFLEVIEINKHDY